MISAITVIISKRVKPRSDAQRGALKIIWLPEQQGTRQSKIQRKIPFYAPVVWEQNTALQFCHRSQQSSSPMPTNMVPLTSRSPSLNTRAVGNEYQPCCVVEITVKICRSFQFRCRLLRSGTIQPVVKGLQCPQSLLAQQDRAIDRGWPSACRSRRMRSNRGFTLLEAIIVMGMLGALGAMALPVMFDANNRNSVWTASEQIGSQVRQARLMAITRNSSFQVRFNCPAAGQFRLLVVDANINDGDRCTQYRSLPGGARDSGVMSMPANVTFGNPPGLQVNGRGQYSIVGAGALPLTVTVQHSNGHARAMTISITGQISFATF
jgi:type II secretory pathway pseudopilin PulG